MKQLVFAATVLLACCSQPATRKDQLGPELSKLKANYLSVPREILAAAIESGARQLAPEELREAKAHLSRAAQYIELNPTDREGIWERVERATSAAHWARQVASHRADLSEANFPTSTVPVRQNILWDLLPLVSTILIGAAVFFVGFFWGRGKKKITEKPYDIPRAKERVSA